MTDAALTQTAGRREIEAEPTTGADDATPASLRVVDAVASVTGADPMTMDPLYHVVDTDALDQLVASDLDGHVQFDLDGHEVRVHGDGRIVVDGTEHGGA